MVRLVGLAVLLASAEAADEKHQTCGDMKTLYKDTQCCKAPTKKLGFQAVPFPDVASKIIGTNPCLPVGQKGNNTPSTAKGNPKLWNIDCKMAIKKALEQAGGDVTQNAKGEMANATGNNTITKPFFQAGLCPVNVHWHLGTEHRSQGEYDETGTAPGGNYLHPPTKMTQPAKATGGSTKQITAPPQRYGYACKKYDANNVMFTKQYKFRHCENMSVGHTYEIHWPHSKLGACGTPWQYQTLFYDGVFCNSVNSDLGPFKSDYTSAVGVQAQVFVVVNDEKYYYPDLMRGMIVGGDYGKEITAYSGSTTGTKRNNKVCSQYSAITWQVDRKCHLISASSFDKMCADMKQQADDLSGDLHPHGAREIVAKDLQTKKVNSGLNHAARNAP